MKKLILAALFVLCIAFNCYGKTIIYPYLAMNSDKGWESNVQFCNTTNSTETIEIVVWADSGNGSLWDYATIEVPPMETEYYTPSANANKFWLQCTMGDGVQPSCLLFNTKNGGETHVPGTTRTERVYPNYSSLSVIKNTDTYEFYGKSSCNYLKGNLLLALRYSAHDVYNEIKTRKTPLKIGDATPINGTCEGHTLGGHYDGETFDVNYFTMDGVNSTDGAPNPVNIWDENSTSDNMILLEDKVDWEKIYLFITQFAKHAGNDYRTTILHEEIRNLILGKLTPYNKKQAFVSLTTPDVGRNANHHLHMHVACD